MFWAFWLGDFFATQGQQAVLNGGLTGIEAFAWSNINLWFGIIMILGNMVALAFGGRE